MVFEYSPLPRQQYELMGAERCEASEIGKLDKGDAVWNLFWLSIPKIDLVPESGYNWWKVYSPVQDAAATLTADVYGEEVLYRKLRMHPQAFIEWFRREDLSIYDSYDLLGGEAWRETVLERAQMAIDRLHMSAKAVLSQSANVVYANFGRKIA